MTVVIAWVRTKTQNSADRNIEATPRCPPPAPSFRSCKLSVPSRISRLSDTCSRPSLDRALPQLLPMEAISSPLFNVFFQPLAPLFLAISSSRSLCASYSNPEFGSLISPCPCPSAVGGGGGEDSCSWLLPTS